MFVNKPHVYRICFRFLPRISCNNRLSTLNTSISEKTQRIYDNINDESHSEHTTDDFSRALYDDPIQTSLLQKALLTVGSSILSITDPYRHDMVAVLGETTGYIAAKQIREKMLQDPEGSSILSDKPRINSDTLDYQFLESLPDGSLGHAYMAFLKDNNVTPDTRRPVHFVDDPELAYVIQRYREVHDLNHTLLGMPTNMLGEVAVKWIEAMQTGLPMCAAGALLGPVRFRKKQRERYLKYYLPWSVNCGSQAKYLMNVYFEKRWHQSIRDLRNELKIPDFPVES